MEGLKEQLEQLRQKFRDDVARRLETEPDKAMETIARECNVGLNWVQRLAKERGLSRRAKKTEVANG